MAIAIREQVLAAFKAQLDLVAPETLAGPVVVTRNMRAEFDAGPALNLIDGGQEAQEDIASRLTQYALDVTVEGYLEAASDDELGPALSDLYAAAAKAALADRTLGGLAVDIAEKSLDVDLERGQGTAAAAWLGIGFRITFWALPGDPYAAAP